MALHKLLLGDKAEAARFLPLARTKLRHLKEQMAAQGLSTWTHRLKMRDGGSLQVSVVEGEETIRIKAEGGGVFWGKNVALSGTVAGVYVTRVSPSLSNASTFKSIAGYTYTPPLDEYSVNAGVIRKRLIGMVLTPNGLVSFYRVPLKVAGRASQSPQPFFQLQLPPPGSDPYFADLIYNDKFGVTYGPIATGSGTRTYQLSLWSYAGVQVVNASYTLPVPAGDAVFHLIWKGTGGHFYAMAWVLTNVGGGIKQSALSITKRHVSAPGTVLFTYPTLSPPLPLTNEGFEHVTEIYARDGLIIIGWGKYTNTGPNDSALWKFDIWVLDDASGAVLASFTDTDIRRIVTDRGSLYAITMSTVNFPPDKLSATIPFKVDRYRIEREEAQLQLTLKDTLVEASVSLVSSTGLPFYNGITDEINWFATNDV